MKKVKRKEGDPEEVKEHYEPDDRFTLNNDGEKWLFFVPRYHKNVKNVTNKHDEEPIL